MTRKIILVIGILSVFLILFLIFGRKYYTKRFSPEDHSELVDGNLRVLVFYNRPLKRGREIFGGLVPYGVVWRTGANEATWFQTNRNLLINGEQLQAGRYSLWTIPNESSWKVIFNAEIPPWGIDYNSHAARNPKADVISMDVPVLHSDSVVQQFTISIEKTVCQYQLNLNWDRTIISVPFNLIAP